MKRTRKKHQKTINRLKYINYVLLGSVITLAISTAIYFKTQPDTKQENIKSEKIVKNKTYELKIDNNYIKNRQDEFEEFTNEFENEYTHEKPIKEEKKEVAKPQINNKPKLAILIDDVTTQTQVTTIQNIGYIVNMAFLPPTKDRPNSAKITKNLPFYMVHYPMEAISFSAEEEGTLKVGDSYEKIDAYIARVRDLYPNARYLNNHTGSKFTADNTAMDRLFRALKKYDFIFLDSRTTAKTLAKVYAAKYDVPFLSRNIFLDNEIKEDKIQEQLKKAIAYAKQHGSAVAIGHPYKQTMNVLKGSKNLLKDIELVYVKDIPTL